MAYATHSVPYRGYIIHTGSMTPTIPPESVVIVRTGEYHVGQVISFNTYNGVTTHRLVSVKDGMITTKGDANPTADPWKLPTSNIIGQVVAAPKRVGFFLEYLRNPAGAASLVLLFLLVWQIWGLTTEAAVALDRKEDVRSLSARSVFDSLPGLWSAPRQIDPERPPPAAVPSLDVDVSTTTDGAYSPPLKTTTKARVGVSSPSLDRHRVSSGSRR